MTAAIAALKARGFNSPYLRNFVVARTNPLRFIKGEPPPLDELLPSMTKRARGMDVGKIKNEDVARTGGAPEAAANERTTPTPRAVIFDLDGTLTEPVLDFDAMRAEIGLPEGVPILEQLDGARRGGARARRGDPAAPRARGDRAGDAGRRLRRSARPPARRWRSRSRS